MTTLYNVDIIDGNSGRKTKDGWELVRMAKVTGIPTTLSGYQRAVWAAERSDIPSIGDAHPYVTSAYLKSIDVQTITSEDVTLSLNYVEELNSILSIDIATSAYQVETNKDYKGDLVKIHYKYPDDYEHDESLRGKIISKSPTLTKDAHDTVVTIVKKEKITYSDLLRKNKNFVNKLNKKGWSLDNSLFDGEWKCIDIAGTDNKDGLTYTVTYVFAYRPLIWSTGVGSGSKKVVSSGWNDDVLYRDERTGEPPSDVVVYVDANVGTSTNEPYGIKEGVQKDEIVDFDLIIDFNA